MSHPFFKSSKFLFIYFSIWTAISVVHIYILTFIYLIPLNIAIADGLISNFLFAFLGIPIWWVVAFTPKGKYAQINQFINHITSVTIVIITWISLCNYILNYFFNLPDYSLFIEQSLTWRIISGLFFYSILTMFYYVIIYYDTIQEQNKRESLLNEMVKQAALDNLRSQINPHFLFNSLNSISSLTLINPEKAQQMIIDLSDFLRYSISQINEKFSVFETEIENMKRYLDIEQIRFGDKLIHAFEIEEPCFQKMLPSMILQPLYENAVKHGVYESTQTIRIYTSCEVKENMLILRIQNNFDLNIVYKKGSGIGLKNIKERLKLIYGDSSLLQTKIEEDLFTAELTIPQ